MIAFFLAVSVILTNAVATFALYRSGFSKLARYHSLAFASLSLWAVSSVAAEQYRGDLATNDLFNKAAYLFSYFGLLGLVMFSRSFLSYTQKRSGRERRALVTAFIAVIYGLVTVTPLIAGSVELGADQQILFLQGPLIGLHALVCILLLFLVAKNLIKRTRRGNYAEKNQARFIIFGLSLTVIVGIVLNIIIPALNPGFDNAGIFSALLVLFTVLPTSYALVKHRLVDVRPMAARGIAMIMLIITVGAIYLLAILGLNKLFFDSIDASGAVMSFYAVVTLTLGFLVHPLYTLYGRLMGRIFLHRVYQNQDVINELNTVLVSTLKISALMSELQRVVRNNLDTQFTVIKLLKKDHLYSQGRTGPFTRSDLAAIDLEVAQLHRRGKQVVSIRDIAVDPNRKVLTELMLKHHIEVVALIKQGNSTLGSMYVSRKNSELPYTNQDLDIIKIIINQAGLAIQNALLYHEVSLLNSTLQDRVSDATRELRRSNARLLELDKSKDEFISIASHQLRTPLTTIKGYLSMILEGSMGKVVTSQRSALQQSFDSSERMSFVVSDLLNLTRLRTGKFLLEKRPTNLADVIENELKSVKEQAKARKLKIIYNKPNSFPELMLDETKIRQVVKNFVYNALFYTLPGGSVTVLIEEINDRVEFGVIDTGIGVAENDKKHLFRQFYRATNARDVRPDGTGVGLFLAREIIMAHGGKVIFESKLGEGSTFGFSFSKKQLASQEKK